MKQTRCNFRRGAALLLSLLCVMPAFDGITAQASSDISADEVSSVTGRDTYYHYLQQYADRPLAEQVLTPDAGTVRLENATLQASWEGKENVIQMTEDAAAEWTMEIPAAGRYCLELTYRLDGSEGKGADIAFQLDGEHPYTESRSLALKTLWRDVGEVQTDAQGNDRIPQQEEVLRWQTVLLHDYAGYTSEPLQVYLESGAHTLRLSCTRGAAAIAGMRLVPLPAPRSYATVKQEYDRLGYTPVETVLLPYEAERTLEKTDQTLYPTYDRSSPATSPYVVNAIKRNTIGQQNWANPGMAVTYEVNTERAGLYQLTFKYKQNLQTGMATYRNISVNGEIPFAEMKNVAFPFGFSWENKTICDENGEPCYVYLNAGRNTIRLEATIGPLSAIFESLDAVVYRMNELYRRILMVTGASPDSNRDYYLEREIPEMVPELASMAESLRTTAQELQEKSGGKSSQAETFRRIADLLQELSDYPARVPLRLTDYRNEISAITNWIIAAKSQTLELDYFLVHSADAVIPAAEATFWRRLVNGVQVFFQSFVEDYSTVQEDGAGESITVWSSDGREQVQILKDLINDRFTPESGIHVNLNLVQGGFIEATLAGRGPDVAIGVARGQPVNLACRNALLDLSSFPGFREVTERFHPQAMIPYAYNGGYYALPNAQQFFMMFYRTDIFAELELEPPETWDDLIALLPVLDRYHMMVGLPYATVSAQAAVDGGLGSKDVFPMLLMQKGGSYYNDDLSATGFDSPEAVDAFKMWVDFYVKRGFPLTFDFNTRFRSGEMPLGIAAYQTYNLLSVAAPEIRNQWAMLPVPGMRKEDGHIDRTVGTSGSATVIFRKAKNPDACWKFVDWWTTDDVQTAFGISVENILGPAGRYTPANVGAMDRLPWSQKELAVLHQQMEHIREIPEVPGSYYVSRSLDNALRKATYSVANAREAFEQENEKINREIQRKRKELGLAP